MPPLCVRVDIHSELRDGSVHFKPEGIPEHFGSVDLFDCVLTAGLDFGKLSIRGIGDV